MNHYQQQRLRRSEALILLHCQLMRQIRKQLGLGSAFQLFEASQVLDLNTGFGVVQVTLPPGEFLVALQDPVGIRRYGVVRFEGLSDAEGWSQD